MRIFPQRNKYSNLTLSKTQIHLLCLLYKTRERKRSGRQRQMGGLSLRRRLFQSLSESVDVHVLAGVQVCVRASACRGHSVASAGFLWALLYFCAMNTIVACFEPNCQWLIIVFLAICSVSGSARLFCKHASKNLGGKLPSLQKPRAGTGG